MAHLMDRWPLLPTVSSVNCTRLFNPKSAEGYVKSLEPTGAAEITFNDWDFFQVWFLNFKTQTAPHIFKNPPLRP